MWDYLRTLGFQKGFLNEEVLKVISIFINFQKTARSIESSWTVCE